MQQDDCVGQVLAALDRLKLKENTIVFFTSDNGCSNQADLPALRAKGHDPVRPFRGHKADIFEGGHRVPLIVRWPGTVASASHAKQTVCLVDLMATVADVANIDLPDDAAPDSFQPVAGFAESKRRSVAAIDSSSLHQWFICAASRSV